MTRSRPLQTPTTACGCEDSHFNADPDNCPTQTDPSHRARDQYLTLRLSLFHLFSLSLLHLHSSRFFFPPHISPQLRCLTSSSGKSLSLPHSHSARFHTFLASAMNCNIDLFICRVFWYSIESQFLLVRLKVVCQSPYCSIAQRSSSMC